VGSRQHRAFWSVPFTQCSEKVITGRVDKNTCVITACRLNMKVLIKHVLLDSGVIKAAIDEYVRQGG
jgi:hypothetical protein